VTRSLHQFAAERAERRPEKTAIVLESERLTYGELEHRSNRLARALWESGVRRGDRVCILMTKSPAAVVAMHGILKTGAMYVPLDPASPVQRLQRMIDACDDRWILAAGQVGPTLAALSAADGFTAKRAIGWLGDGAAPRGVSARWLATELESLPGDAFAAANSPRDPAHILFTSGSTGTPKGVVITHENVAHFVAWALAYFGITEDDRTSGHPPLHFDLSTFYIFGTLAAGATLHMVPPEINLLPQFLTQFIRRAELTQWFSVPTTLNLMAKFDVVRDGDFPALRRVLWCGERLPTPSLIYLMRRLPNVRFTNLYGPTEATIASSFYTIPERPRSADAEIPIGNACPGEELLVLDGDLRPVPPNTIGDLYIRGVGLSPGYWRDDVKTQDAFRVRTDAHGLPDRLYRTGDLATVGTDGLFRYVGRSDFQIKSRGYRIDAGEIETAMHSLNMFQECAVVGVMNHEVDGATICCGYVPALGVELTAAQFRAALAPSLPSYMIPVRWLAFESLPKTSNGKIDRRSLQECFTVAAAEVA